LDGKHQVSVPFILQRRHFRLCFSSERRKILQYGGIFCPAKLFAEKELGTLFALDIIQKHPGKWHIEYNVKNTAGMQFWNTLILNLVGAHYKKGPGEEENREYLEFIVGGK
jgi:hypothetical protein